MRYHERTCARRKKASAAAVTLADELRKYETLRTIGKAMGEDGGYRPKWPLDLEVGETPVTLCGGTPATFKLLKSAKLTRRRWVTRLWVMCPDCGKWLPYGRLGQHIGAATCKT